MTKFPINGSLRRFKAVFISVLIISSMLPGKSFAAEKYSYWEEEPYIPRAGLPNKEAKPFSFACYDVWSGETINCDFKIDLKSNDQNNGGHNHPGRLPGAIRLKGSSGNGSTTILANTGGQNVEYEYLIPEISGTNDFFVEVTKLPPRYTCTDCTWKVDINLMYQGLVQLPTSSPFHTVVRSPQSITAHPEGNYGTPGAISSITGFSQEYFLATGNKLSVNDMSLPAGGLFDINDNWGTPHSTHRVGTSVDINHIDGGGFQVDETFLDEQAKIKNCSRWERDVGLIHYECK